MYPDFHKWEFPLKTFWYDEKEIEDDDNEASLPKLRQEERIKHHRRKIWRFYWSCYGYLEWGQEEMLGLTPIGYECWWMYKMNLVKKKFVMRKNNFLVSAYTWTRSWRGKKFLSLFWSFIYAFRMGRKKKKKFFFCAKEVTDVE